MSSLDNPTSEIPSPEVVPKPPRGNENPPWGGWDVVSILVLTFCAIVSFLLAVTYVAERIFFRNLPFKEVATFPLVTVVAQMLAYVLVLAFMVSLAWRRGSSFLDAIRWNWPGNGRWVAYVFGGFLLSIGLQGVAHFLPMPKELPIDQFFHTPAQAWALSLFGVSFAPVMEEFFFRGFLYPVLERRIGLFLAVLLTSAGFGLLHVSQLGRAWGPVLIVFLVGVALTVTRAVTKSVSAGLLMHIAYNATLTVLIYAVTDGFKHLEKMKM